MANLAMKKKSGTENISGYFRAFYKANPKLLQERSNDVVIKQWLADHPGTKEVPDNIKGALSNIKSVMRSKSRRRKADLPDYRTDGAPAAAKQVSPRTLEALEISIDECIATARQADPEGLAEIIQHLRRARNKVVWVMGEPA